MSRFTDFASRMIQNNQNNIPRTPWAQQGINAILNGDAKTGEELANNLLHTMGMTREQAIEQAKRQMNLSF